MQYKALVLAAAVLLSFGTSGAAASMTTVSPAGDGPLPSVATEQPDDYTVDVVDPSDDLSSQDIEDARQIIWKNADVERYVDDPESVHLEVWAPVNDDDHVSVWIAENETAPTQVIVDIDLEDGSIVDVDEPEVRSVDTVQTIDFDATSLEQQDDGISNIEIEGADGESGNENGEVIHVSQHELNVVDVNETEFTVVEENKNED